MINMGVLANLYVLSNHHYYLNTAKSGSTCVFFVFVSFFVVFFVVVFLQYTRPCLLRLVFSNKLFQSSAFVIH